jgi:hypothetical protein
VRFFVQRQNNKPEVAQSYTVYLLFLLAIAFRDRNKKFFKHHIHEETGEFAQFLEELFHLMAREERLETLVVKIREFDKKRIARSQLKYDLGGMIELGDFNSVSLWHSLFNHARVDDFKGRTSLERHFICYRFSSLGREPKIVKSFLVFQSPGLLSGGDGAIRNHFAFKVFYKNQSTKIRRSAGAVLHLGKTITCFGSSRMVDASKPSEPLAYSGDRGPKSLVFTAPNTGDRMLFGVMMSMNEDQIPIASRVVAVETVHQHSKDAGIGSMDPKDLEMELMKNAIFADTIESEERARQGWTNLIDLLRAEVPAGTLVTPPGLTRRGLYG